MQEDRPISYEDAASAPPLPVPAPVALPAESGGLSGAQLRNGPFFCPEDEGLASLRCPVKDGMRHSCPGTAYQPWRDALGVRQPFASLILAWIQCPDSGGC